MKRTIRLLSLFFALILPLAGCSLPAGETKTTEASPPSQEITREETAPLSRETEVGSTSPATLPSTAPATAPSPTEEAKPAHTLSPLATETALLPLETFSRERTQKPQFIMIHFTSAVVLNPSDPYNMTAVRKILPTAR